MIFLNAHSKQSNDYEILLLQPGAVNNYFILHNLCTSLTLSDFSIMWLAVLTGWSSLFLTRVELLSSTQTVFKRKKNIKSNRQVLVITLPLWLWDWPIASHVNGQTKNKGQMGTNSSRPHCQVREATLTLQGDSSHGRFMQELPWKFYPPQPFTTAHFYKWLLRISFYYGLSKRFWSLQLLGAWWDCRFVLRPSQTFCISTLVTQQCRWIPVNTSLAHPSCTSILKSSSILAGVGLCNQTVWTSASWIKWHQNTQLLWLSWYHFGVGIPPTRQN